MALPASSGRVICPNRVCPNYYYPPSSTHYPNELDSMETQNYTAKCM
eukprot:SAG11_NODE_3246_length_2583_cov_3.256844_3_plen_47_part_00